jgi:hypothetical protein
VMTHGAALVHVPAPRPMWPSVRRSPEVRRAAQTQSHREQRHHAHSSSGYRPRTAAGTSRQSASERCS